MNKREIINSLLDWSAKFAYLGSTAIHFSYEPYPEGDLITVSLCQEQYSPFHNYGGPWGIKTNQDYERVEDLLSKEYEAQLKEQIPARRSA